MIPIITDQARGVWRGGRGGVPRDQSHPEYSGVRMHDEACDVENSQRKKKTNPAALVINFHSLPAPFGANVFLIPCSFGDFNFQLILPISPLRCSWGVRELLPCCSPTLSPSLLAQNGRQQA